MRISDWSSDVCSSDLPRVGAGRGEAGADRRHDTGGHLVPRFRPPDAGPGRRLCGTPRVEMIIAVAGPVAAGKGKLARRLAEALRCASLDTGSLSRAETGRAAWRERMSPNV